MKKCSVGFQILKIETVWARKSGQLLLFWMMTWCWATVTPMMRSGWKRHLNRAYHPKYSKILLYCSSVGSFGSICWISSWSWECEIATGALPRQLLEWTHHCAKAHAGQSHSHLAPSRAIWLSHIGFPRGTNVKEFLCAEKYVRSQFLARREHSNA